jgi:hypothetical protein
MSSIKTYSVIKFQHSDQKYLVPEYGKSSTTLMQFFKRLDVDKTYGVCFFHPRWQRADYVVVPTKSLTPEEKAEISMLKGMFHAGQWISLHNTKRKPVFDYTPREQYVGPISKNA